MERQEHLYQREDKGWGLDQVSIIRADFLKASWVYTGAVLGRLDALQGQGREKPH